MVLRTDFGRGARSEEVRGAEAVASRARAFSLRGLVTHTVLINGAIGVVATRDGEPFSVGGFLVRNGRIVEIDFLLDPERLARLDLSFLGG